MLHAPSDIRLKQKQAKAEEARNKEPYSPPPSFFQAAISSRKRPP